MFKTIVVATDSSDHARKAIRIAGDLADKYAARLIVTHVVDPHRNSPELRHMAEVEHLIKSDPGNKGLTSTLGLPGDWAARMSSLRESATDNLTILTAIGEHLLKSARQELPKSVTNVETRLEQGDPVECILEVLRNEQADLVVLGTRGLGELKGMLMGSVSHKLSNLAPCPCLTVK